MSHLFRVEAALPTPPIWVTAKKSSRDGKFFRQANFPKRRQVSQNPFLGVCHIRQSLHCRTLVIRRKVRVLARDCRAFVPHNLSRNKI